MKNPVVGIYANPLARARSMFARGVRFKANPRDRDYMRSLFHETWPDGRFIDADQEPDWTAALADDSHAVLLYPDALGLGFAPIERRLPPGWIGNAGALNGRRRCFMLDRSTLRALRLRRFLSWTMAGEAVFAGHILLATPPLLLWDLLRGRR